MKAKSLNKKLVLKKETISLLTNSDLDNVKGGASYQSKCETRCITCEGLRITC
jgi:hypothetical protein